ncbi:MAG: TonB-dependent receptor [Acidobacteria bacterium]|nr:TonB-dependent receptor [Acidobacteriota bacterium]
MLPLSSRFHRLLLVAFCLLAWPASHAFAQGVTTGSMAGVVTDAQSAPVAGASVIAIHVPSGTNYETTTRADGRFAIIGMRVGGPYIVTVAYTGTGTAFEPQTVEDITVNLGVGTDVNVTVRNIAVEETVTVIGRTDPVFSSNRTGAATVISRADVATLPTVSARISDITRLTPQASGSSFAGQDNRLNNITVDGSYFNNSFGLGGEPGARTNVAPISLESLEQVQVSVAPYDVRQGSFIGAAVNTVTRSGTNRLTASVYHRMRNDGWVGTEADGNTVNPGTFTFRNTGGWAGGPIVRNRLFAFGTYENEEDKRPLHTFQANAGGQPVGGSITRVLGSDMDTLAAYLKNNFNYDPGTYIGLQDLTPVKRYLVRSDLNLNSANKVSFRYNQLDSSSTNHVSGSSSAGIGRPTFTTNFLAFSGTNYDILENIKSGIGEWNSVIGNNMANNLIVGLTSNDESRGDVGTLFPFVDILQDGTAMTSFGSEAFSVQNELRYKTFQLQDSFTKFGAAHTLTFGISAQRYHSDNVFWSCCPQSSYAYNSLADFYTDANDYLANPNRTVSPVNLRFFKVRYSNVPGLDKPLQPLTVWYNGAYAQDEWRPRTDLTVTAGIRADVSLFDQTGYQNAKADALTFRSQSGDPVQFSTGELPETKVLWSPRAAMNWDIGGRQRTQLRLGTGLFTGPPLYVWISNQLGNSGVLIGETVAQNTTAFPFNPNPDTYKPATVTGEGAASFELNVTDPNFKFPQVWRTNVAVDHKLPGGVVGTVEFLYNKDVNGTAYYNANLPAAQTAFTGVDNRPRWTANRINNTTPNIITNAIILTNQGFGKSWNLSTSLSKTLAGLTLRGAYSYGQSENAIDAGSTAFSSFANNQHAADPNNPGIGRSGYTQGHRTFISASYSKEYFSFGSTTVSMFWEARPSNQNFANVASYVFNGDMNGDGAAGNDLIYIPRDRSEMNFVAFTTGGRTFSVAEQEEAFEAYIQQDSYLKNHRGQYAERGGLNMAMFNRMDLSFVQDLFKNIGGKRNAAQFRIDVANFGNLLNSDWGVARRLVLPTTAANGAQILTNAAPDAQGRVSYRMAVVNNELVRNTFQGSTTLSDVYQIMLSFRYSFN